MPNCDDISSNLAHTYLLQNRLLDAERLYIATLRNVAASAKTADVVKLLQWTSLSQFKQQRLDEAMRSLLQALHYQPDYMADWFNVAIVNEYMATNYVSAGPGKTNKAVQDIIKATRELKFAKEVFSFLNRIHVAGSSPYEKKATVLHESVCHANISVFDEHLRLAQEEEVRRGEEKRLVDLQKELIEQERERDRQRRAEEEEQRIKEVQQLAQQKEKKLRELQNKWTTTSSNTNTNTNTNTTASSNSNSNNNRKKKRSKIDSIDISKEEDFSDEDEEVQTQQQQQPLGGGDSSDDDFFSNLSKRKATDDEDSSDHNNNKTMMSNKDNDNDDDDDDLFGGPSAGEEHYSAVTGKRGRVVEDSSDEEKD